VAELEEQLNTEIKKNMDYKEIITNQTKESLVDEVCEGLTLNEKGKIQKLAESVSFGNKEEFVTKIKTLKESYFPNAKIVRPNIDSLNDNSLILEDSTVITDPMMKSILDSVSRTAKR